MAAMKEAAKQENEEEALRELLAQRNMWKRHVKHEQVSGVAMKMEDGEGATLEEQYSFPDTMAQAESQTQAHGSMDTLAKKGSRDFFPTRRK